MTPLAVREKGAIAVCDLCDDTKLFEVEEPVGAGWGGAVRVATFKVPCPACTPQQDTAPDQKSDAA